MSSKDSPTKKKKKKKNNAATIPGVVIHIMNLFFRLVQKIPQR
jgi:hypothetical protein